MRDEAIPPKHFALAQHRGYRVYLLGGGHCVVYKGAVVQRDLTMPDPAPKGRPARTYQKPPVPRWILRVLRAHIDELRALSL